MDNRQNSTNINWEMEEDEKHFRSFINKEKNSNFYLYILNKFYWIF